MSVKVTSVLSGLEQFKRGVQLANTQTRANVVAAIRKNTKAVASKAKAAAPHVTGELASTVRDEYSNDGLIGYAKVGFGKLPRRSQATTATGIARAKGRRRKVGKGAYGPVVERGDPRRHHKPHPFLIPAFSGQVPTAKQDIGGALNNALEVIP